MLETWLWLGERPDVKGSKGTVVGVIRKMGDTEVGGGECSQPFDHDPPQAFKKLSTLQRQPKLGSATKH